MFWSTVASRLRKIDLGQGSNLMMVRIMTSSIGIWYEHDWGEYFELKFLGHISFYNPKCWVQDFLLTHFLVEGLIRILKLLCVLNFYTQLEFVKTQQQKIKYVERWQWDNFEPLKYLVLNAHVCLFSFIVYFLASKLISLYSVHGAPTFCASPPRESAHECCN